MAAPSVTNTFTNGTTANATEVNQNFTDIINGVSDGTKDLTISALTAGGTATFNGNVTIGNASADTLTITASLSSSIPIGTNNSYNIGAATLGLASIYLGAPSSRTTRIISDQSIAGSITVTLPRTDTTMPTADGAAKDVLVTDGAGAWSFSGGPAPSAKTSNYTVTTADKVLTADGSGGSFTFTLYAASGNSGRTVTIINIGTSGEITIDGNGAETINGNATIILRNQYEAVTLTCNGSNWLLTSHRKGANSMVRLIDSNGYGSTNTVIKRFTTTTTNTGLGITYSDSATNGASFTIEETGIFHISYTNQAGSAVNYAGLSKNSSELTTNIDSITAADRLAMAAERNTDPVHISWTGILTDGDVIRVHERALTDGDANKQTFTIAHIGFIL